MSTRIQPSDQWPDSWARGTKRVRPTRSCSGDRLPTGWSPIARETLTRRLTAPLPKLRVPNHSSALDCLDTVERSNSSSGSCMAGANPGVLV
jgi:hypothetical protein